MFVNVADIFFQWKNDNAYSQLNKAEETLTQQNQEECMRAEKENHDSESERSELLAQIHDLTENNTQYCDRGSSPYVKQEVDNLNQYQRDSSSTNEMQMRRSEKVYLGSRKEKSQCGQTCTLSKVKCVKCEQRFSDTHLNLERKGLDEVSLTNFSYTCQNCKNEHGKKRRKLGFLTPELVPKRYC